MWTRNQLLNEQTVKTLREGGFADLEMSSWAGSATPPTR